MKFYFKENRVSETKSSRNTCLYRGTLTTGLYGTSVCHRVHPGPDSTVKNVDTESFTRQEEDKIFSFILLLL